MLPICRCGHSMSVHDAIGHVDPGICSLCGCQAFTEEDRCANCKTRKATMDWVGEGGVLAWTHGMYTRWCEYCATEAQLKYARERAAAIPELEAKLKALEGGVKV